VDKNVPNLDSDVGIHRVAHPLQPHRKGWVIRVHANALLGGSAAGCTVEAQSRCYIPIRVPLISIGRVFKEA
jgi:hypothetical protein